MAGGRYVFVADGSGTAVYVLSGGSSPRLSRWPTNGDPRHEPDLAGGLLYVYDPSRTGRSGSTSRPDCNVLDVAAGGDRPLEQPDRVGGRIIVPEGNANDHSTSGTVDIYHLPGR